MVNEIEQWNRKRTVIEATGNTIDHHYTDFNFMKKTAKACSANALFDKEFHKQYDKICTYASGRM